MQLAYTRDHHLSKLHDELLAAVPSLQPVMGTDGERRAVMRIWGDGSQVTLDVDVNLTDDDRRAIESVIAAHDPTPPAPPPDPNEELAAAIQAAGTLEELKAALLGQVRKGAAAARHVST